MKKLGFISTLLFLAACTPEENNQDTTTINVASVAPISGPLEVFGNTITESIDYFIEHQIADGFQINHVKFDDQCNPDVAVEKAQEIVSQNFDIVIGHLCSSSTNPSRAIYAGAGILQISAVSTRDDLYDFEPQSTFFGVSPSDNTELKKLAEYAAQSLSGQPYGMYLYFSVDQTELETNINGHANNFVYKSDINSVEEFASQVISSGVGTVISVMYQSETPEANDFNALMLALETAGFTGNLLFTGGWATIALVNTNFSFNIYALTLNSEYNKLNDVEAFLSTNSDHFDIMSYSTFLTMEVLMDAIYNTESVNSTVLASYLKSNDIMTSIGTIRFTQDGRISNYPWVIYKNMTGTNDFIFQQYFY